MHTFIKAQAASIIATIVDFSVTIGLVELLHAWHVEKETAVVAGSATGTIAGGITHFLLGRNWVFNATGGKIRSHAVKYLAVWIVYLLLTTSGVYVLTHYAAVEYIVAKAGVAIVMAVGYNYVLHKKFVFK
jgi:putative flippase GtrA